MSYFSHDDAENAPKTCFHVPYHHPVTPMTLGKPPYVLEFFQGQSLGIFGWAVGTAKRFLSFSGSCYERIEVIIKSTKKLVGGWATPLKNMSSSIGMMRFPSQIGK